MNKRAILHTLPPYHEELGISVGDEFNVLIVDPDDDLVVIDILGVDAAFSIEPDVDGVSVDSWFTIEEERVQ